MAEQSDRAEEHAVRDASAVYSVEPEIAATEDVPPGFKRTEVGVIPTDWEVRQLGHHLKFLRNGTNSRAELTPGGKVKYLHYGDIHTSSRCRLDPKSVNMPHLPMALTKRLDRLKNGDLIFADASEDLEGVGTSLELHTESENEVVAGLHTIAVRFDKSVLADGFKAYLQFCPSFRNHLKSLAAGTKVYATYRSHIAGAIVPLPYVHEQRAIATALSDADALIESLDRMIAKKRAIKQATMQQLLTGQTRLPGFTSEWETKRLGNIAEMSSGGTPPSAVNAYYGGDIPWVSITDMTEGGKTLTSTERNLTKLGLSVSAAQLFPCGTVLYAMYASLGECSISAIELCSSQAILGITPRRSLHAEFLYYWLLEAKERIKLIGQQGTQSNLNKGMVQDFRIQLPSAAEQTAIATVLSDMDTEIKALEHRRDKARQIKQGMMKQLLTGRVRLVEAKGEAGE